MSTLKVDSIESRTSGARVTLPDLNFLPPYRNIIINGDMSIAQRGTTATGLGNGDGGYHTIDRFNLGITDTPTYEFTMSQDADVPTGQGFTKSLKLSCTTAQASLGTGNALRILTGFEGQNLQYLKYGTANAESLTASFWIKSNKTGDYCVALYNSDTIDITTKTITINSADTWEKKTLTFSGDTSNAFNNDNGASLFLWICFLAGTNYNTSSAVNWTSYSAGRLAYGQTVNLADSTSNYINITGVQLEAGDSATPFEHLPYDVNLGRCQRYFEKSYNYETAIGTATFQGCVYGSGSYSATTTSYLNASTVYSVEKRATPTLTIYDAAGNSAKCTREHFGVGSSHNSSIIITSDANAKRFGVTSNTGDNRTHIAYQFTANAEI